MSESYIRRLEAAGAAPGIDMLDRLAAAIGTTPSDLLPAAKQPDDLAVVRGQARRCSRVCLQRKTGRRCCCSRSS